MHRVLVTEMSCPRAGGRWYYYWLKIEVIFVQSLAVPWGLLPTGVPISRFPLCVTGRGCWGAVWGRLRA